MRIFILFAIIFFMALQPVFAGDDGVVIRKIDIRSNQRVEQSTINSYLKIKVGDKIDQDKVNASLKQMYATELFSNISMNMEGSTLVVKIQENPIVNKIAFEGNKRVNDDAINAQIALKPRSVYTKSKVQSDVLLIQDLYRKSGRYSTKVEPKIVMLDQNRVDLVFEIEEGEKASVKKIYFIGNKKFDSEKLRKILNTKESHWYTFYSSGDSYDPDRVSFDRELLRKFYTSKGYADFNVSSVTAEITEDKESFILHFTVEEGEKYRFGNINVTSLLPDVNKETFRNDIKTEKGEIYNSILIDNTVDKITTHLNNMGYAFVDIAPEFKKDVKNKIIDVTYNIKEGPKVYIGKVNIAGNVRTLDKVVRREMRMAEGDPYNATQIARSKQRIQNLGFFDKVDVKTERGDEPDKANVNVSVTEKPTGELNFGAGYSTTEGMLGNVSIRERNLLGTARDVKLSLQKSARGNQIDLGVIDPYFMDRDLAASFNVYDITRDNSSYSSYSSVTQGFTVTGTYSITEDLRHTLKYALTNVTIDNIQSGASTYIVQQGGTTLTSLIGHTLMYDKRDNKFDPTSGYYASFSQDVAGFGGDSKFFRNEARYGYYKPVVREDVIFNTSVRSGWIFGLGGQDVRINDRFFIGGSSLRGFKDAGIGPRDKYTTDALGGNSYYAGTLGFTFPLGLPDELGFKGEVFIDAGSLYGLDEGGPTILDSNAIRASAGFGVLWTSPLGPIKIDFAEPLMKLSYDKTQILRFDFGTRF
jgi:outer membrane protein insertion porin family